MTDREIMKALECCREKGLLCESCDECPNLAMGSLCIDQMLRDAINLINRQKAETKRLEVEKDNLIRTYAECQSEVLKEFAERLKEEFARYGAADDVDVIIDNLLKEWWVGIYD